MWRPGCGFVYFYPLPSPFYLSSLETAAVTRPVLARQQRGADASVVDDESTSDRPGLKDAGERLAGAEAGAGESPAALWKVVDMKTVHDAGRKEGTQNQQLYKQMGRFPLYM